MEQKTPVERMAERRDAWKIARSMLRESDMRYDTTDVAMLADWLAGRYVAGLDDDDDE